MIRKISADGTIPSTQLSMAASVSHVHGNLNAAKAPPLSEVTYAMGGWVQGRELHQGRRGRRHRQGDLQGHEV